MYKMIIVDDEQWVREGIRQSINWPEYDVEVLYEADNGEEAFRIIDQFAPDIAIVDIKMPLMSGLDLANCIVEKGLDTQVIILTGFSDFNYAKQSIKMGISDYLLKPVDVNELIEAVKKCVHRIALKKEEEQKYMNTLFENLLSGDGNALRKLEDAINENNNVTEDNYLLCVFIFQDKIIRTNLNIETLIIKYLSIYFTYKFSISPNEIAILLSVSESIKPDILQQLKTIMDILAIDFNLDVIVGVSKFGSNLGKIPELYIQASTICYFGIAANNQRIFDIEDQNASGYLFSNANMTNTIINAILLQDKITIRAILKGFLLNRIELNEFPYIDSVRILLIYLMNSITPRIYDELATEMVVEEKNLLNIRNFSVKKTIIDIYSCFFSMIDYLCEFVSPLSKNSKHFAIKASIEYVKSNYKEVIKLNDVAKYVHLDPSYFSKIFSKEMGISFSNYVVLFRIKKAKDILSSNSSIKIYKVATETGFVSAKYFTKIFKQIEGITPELYRNSMMKQ
jgi:two-component system, response regulator YesN